MLRMLILMSLLHLSTSKKFKRHVENSALPLFYKEPTYNISRWVKVLNLQQCVFVEIGEYYCAIFVEIRSRKTKQLEEYFLGVCDLNTIYRWRLCSVALEKLRPRDCRFRKNAVEVTDVGARVHRRLCDVTGLSFHADHCNCKSSLGNQKLRPVTGFPTCFLSPLPGSICFPKNVCGTNKCYEMTILDQIHSVRCDEGCKDHQPFCEELGMKSSDSPKIESYWSDWRKPDCDGPCPSSEFNILEAKCIDLRTSGSNLFTRTFTNLNKFWFDFSGKGAIDCLGPGTSCCPANIERCRCNVFVEDGVLKVIRQFYRDNEHEIDERNPQITDYYLNDQRSPVSYFRKFPRERREKYPEEFEKYLKNVRNHLEIEFIHENYKKVLNKNPSRVTKFLNPYTQIPLSYDNLLDDLVPTIDYRGIGSMRRKREESIEEYSYEADKNAEEIAIEEEVEDNNEIPASTTQGKKNDKLMKLQQQRARSLQENLLK